MPVQVYAGITNKPVYQKDSTGLSTEVNSIFFSVRVMDKSYDEALTAGGSLFRDPVDPVLTENAHAYNSTGYEDRFERFKGGRLSRGGICQCPLGMGGWTRICGNDIYRCVSRNKQRCFSVRPHMVVQRTLETG